MDKREAEWAETTARSLRQANMDSILGDGRGRLAEKINNDELVLEVKIY